MKHHILEYIGIGIILFLAVYGAGTVASGVAAYFSPTYAPTAGDLATDTIPLAQQVNALITKDQANLQTCIVGWNTANQRIVALTDYAERTRRDESQLWTSAAPCIIANGIRVTTTSKSYDLRCPGATSSIISFFDSLPLPSLYTTTTTLNLTQP